jgi:hypothetical protein
MEAFSFALCRSGYFFISNLNSTYPLFYIAAGDKNIDEVMFF